MTVILPNSVFIHIPKTGGMWVRSALEQSDLVTESYGFRHTVPLLYEKYMERTFRFCFVRHPLTWYKSYWAMRSRDNSWDMRVPLDMKCHDGVFNVFIDKLLYHFSGGYLDQLYWQFTEHCIYVGKMEHLPFSLFDALDIAGETYSKDAIRAIAKENVGEYSVNYIGNQADRLIKMDSAAIGRYDYQPHLHFI